MAASGYTPISLYYSTTASATPLAGNLVSGELAINIADGKLFYKDSGGTVQTLATKSSSISPITNNGVVYVNSSGQATSGSALTFDGTNLGIGTGAAASKLDVQGGDINVDAGSRKIGYISGANKGYLLAYDGNGYTGLVNTYVSGALTFSLYGGEGMRLTSTGLGIGTSSPSSKLHVYNGSGTNATLIVKAENQYTNQTASFQTISTVRTWDIGQNLSDSSTGSLEFYDRTGGATRMRLDSSGNLGLGVTPSAWTANAKAIQIVNASFSNDNYAGATRVAYNLYQDTNTTYKYIQSSLNAGKYDIGSNGIHAWYTAPSGTAGNAITFTQAMTLDASGNLGVGTTSPAKKLDVNGDALIYGVTVGRGAGAVSTNTAVGASALSGSNTGGNNTAIGLQALLSNTSGAHNIALGNYSLASNTTGSYNTVVGREGMVLNTTGGYNTAMGWEALFSNTTASNNTAVGYQAGYANTTGTQNTAVGSQALTTNTTGGLNSAFGLNSLYYNTTGSNNTASGGAALQSNTTGQYNTAHGAFAIYSNTTASYNTAVGMSAGYNNTTGNITAIGSYTLYNNTTGTLNVAIGGADGSGAALGNNTTGSYNTAVGYHAVQANTTGLYNTGIGTYALYSNTTADNNTAVGYQAGYSNTTGANNATLGAYSGYSINGGAQNTFVGTGAGYYTTTGTNNVAVGFGAFAYNSAYGTGNSNVAVGREALSNNTTASNNTAVGYQAGYSNTTGYYLTAIGTSALYSNTTGIGNIGVGLNAGYYITTGSKNVILGSYTGNAGGLDIRTSDGYIVLSDGDGNPRGIFDGSGNWLVGTTSTNPTNGFVANTNGNAGFYLQIGHPTGTGSGVAYSRFMYNQTEIGSITQSGTTAVLYNITSDQRLKENIVDAPEFGGVIDSIKVRSYDWKADGNHQRAGFIAQELVAVAPEAVHQPIDPEEMMAVDYSKLVPMLVKEIQSLRARVAQLEGK